MKRLLAIFLILKHLEACSIGGEVFACIYTSTIIINCMSTIQNESSILDFDELNIDTEYINRSQIQLNLQNKVYSRMKNSSINNLAASMTSALTISNNNIERIQAYAFRSMLRAVEIRLDNNSLKEIEAHAFDGLIDLQILTLHSNNLKLIRYGTFN